MSLTKLYRLIVGIPAGRLLGNPTGAQGAAQAIELGDNVSFRTEGGTTYLDSAGEQGPQGDPGDPGVDGADGEDGASAYEVAVANGFSGTESEWLASLVGAKGDKGDTGDPGDPGADGSDGAPGQDGATWLYGSGEPSVLSGAEGDLYLDTATGDVYRKSGGSWGIIANIEGPQGAPGNDGADGDQGPQGDPGPNEITTATTTNLTGLFKGDGETVSAATAGTDYVSPDDARLTDSRTPTSHASSHVTGGTDKIRDASASQDGLMTAAYAAKLDGIDEGAEVNAVTSVAGRTGAVTISTSDVSGLSTALDAKADLVGGVIPSSQIPAIAITEFLGEVADETEMLALVGQKGDWCKRTDQQSVWIIIGNDPSVLSDWTSLEYPGAPVTSVNGQTGSVTLGYADVGADAAGSAASVAAGLASLEGEISATPGNNLVVRANGSGVIAAGWVPSLDASKIGSGTLVHERGGLEADVSAFSGLLHITGGATSAKPLSANGETLINHTFVQMRTDLSLVPGTDVQAYNAGLADIAGLAKTDSNIIVGDGTNWVAESGTTARTSLGVGASDAVQFARMALGSPTFNSTGLFNNVLLSGSGIQHGLNNSPRPNTGATTLTTGLYSQIIHASGSYTCALAVGNYLDNPPALSGGAAITSLHGAMVKDQTRGTNNYGLTCEVSSGTNKLGLNITGTANNYINGNVGIGTSSFGSGAVRTWHIANGTRPTTFPTAGFVAESGEISGWDTSGNFTQLTNHAIDRAIEAGIIINFEDDPVPDIYYTCNVYTGWEKFRYVAPNGDVQVKSRRLPAEKIRDWTADQLEIQEESQRAMRRWECERDAHPDVRYEEIRMIAYRAHEEGKRLRDYEIPSADYKVPPPDLHTPRHPPQWMQRCGIKLLCENAT